MADDTERPELISRITSLVQQYAPSSLWQVDTLLAVLQVSGKYANEEVTSALISIISNEEDELASYTVRVGGMCDAQIHKLFLFVQRDLSQVSLTQVSVWFIGEYGDLLAESYDDDASIKRVVKKNVTLKPVHYDAVEWKDVLGVLQTIGGDRSVLSESLSVLLTTLLKLSDRFGDEAVEDIKEFLGRWRDSNDAELKQRANEYFILLGEDVEAVLNPLLDRMPPLDIDTAKMLRKENELNAESEEEEKKTSPAEEEEKERKLAMVSKRHQRLYEEMEKKEKDKAEKIQKLKKKAKKAKAGNLEKS